MYYPCSENKGTDQLRADQLRGDLHLCFRIGKNPVFSRCSSYVSLVVWKTCLYFRFSNQVQHKLDCTVLEKNKLETRNFRFEKRDCTIWVVADQLCSYCTTNMRLCFRIEKKNLVFSSCSLFVCLRKLSY